MKDIVRWPIFSIEYARRRTGVYGAGSVQILYTRNPHTHADVEHTQMLNTHTGLVLQEIQYYMCTFNPVMLF
jgi:hypothetical protein